MKTKITLKAILLAAVLALVSVVPAQAGFRFGPRVGLEVNKLHFNEDLFTSDNRAGFTGGLQFEVSGLFGFGVDASVMYVRRSAEFLSQNEDVTAKNRDYIDIPINVKYKFSLPLVSKVLAPYVFTGPDFAFLTSGTGINEAWKSKKVDVAWNFGLGVELVSHLQVSASYGIGISKAAEMIGATGGKQDIDGKNRYWTVTAAWLF